MSDHGVSIEEVAEITGSNGCQIFAILDTRLEDDYGRTHGSILLYQNLTGIQTREHRLNVLNRVLRHDIRNEMTAVLGFANEGLSEEIPPTEALDAISKTAQSVVDTSEIAREIERLVNLAPRLEPDSKLQDAMESIHAESFANIPGPPCDLRSMYWPKLSSPSASTRSSGISSRTPSDTMTTMTPRCRFRLSWVRRGCWNAP